ncbi:efflux transporter outer membrane subunit [Novosphingobium sp. 9]|uniref:efflux transporter outer membrane subunit n=1 Tax=Novosphingobium sp. 9 TaxID=2025349 RepID=UPI0021B599DD|nr:efflux transporter outer membrane subunit [Novosphingobium sp. 9]
MRTSIKTSALTRTAALLAPGLLLAGCNMAPKYVRPDLPVPATPAVVSGVQSTAETASAVTDQTLPLGWERFFTDARLRQVLQLSLANNRDLRIAIAHVAEARAQAKVQGAELFPTIAAGGTAEIERTPPGLGATGGDATRYNLYQAQVGVSAWEVDLFGRVRNLTQAAQETYFASAETRRAAQVTLVSEVADAWLQIGADRQQLEIAKNTAAAYEQTLKITQGRAAMGVASDLDVHQAETSYQQARADIASLTTSVAQDRNALDLLVGATVDDALLPNGQNGDDATIAQLPAGLASTVLLKRPDVVSAEHQLRSADANIGAARAAFFPQISLTAAFGTLSLGLSNLFGHNSQNWSVEPSVTLPIFDAGRNLGNLRYAKAERDEMVATYEKAVQTAFREVADALARRATIGDQLDADTKQASAANSALTIAQARYEKGVDTFLTTLDSQRTLYTAQQALVSTQLEKQTNAVELYRALGGGLDAPEAGPSQ